MKATKTPPAKKPKPTTKKVPRLLDFFMMIQGGPPRTAEALARELNVTVRTVRRYINDLDDAKIPVVHDREAGGYRIRGDYFLKPVDLSLGEAVSLALLCEKIAGGRRIPNLGEARLALSKIESNLPLPLRKDVRTLAKRMDVHNASAEHDGKSAAFHATVRDALRTGTALSAVYEPAKPGAEPEAFEFEPYALFFSVRAWYAVGKHSKRKGLRSLKLVRFKSLQRTPRRYEVPNSFTLEKHLGNAWRMMRGETDHAVELLFDDTFAPGIAETFWHPTQCFKHNPDGSLTMTCTVAGLDEIVWWVLGMGPHCRVVAPKELRERVRDLAQRTADNASHAR